MRRLAALLALTATACSDAGVTKFNTPPTAEISSHADGDTVREGFGETLRGTVGDANHTFDQLSVVWLVDGTDVCPESVPDDAGLVTCDHTFLPTGGEVVLEVRDPEGGSGSARVTVDVQSTDAPLAEIIAPTSDGVYYAEQLITFQGNVSDAEDAAEDLTVTWETDALGDLGLTIDVTSEGAVEAFGELEEGEHAVRLRVVDTTGKEGVDSVVIDVGPPNSAPSCEITAPADGSSGAEGEEVRFEATVADVDVPADWLTIEWSSDKDGPLGGSTPTTSGEVVFSYGDLSIDTHTITLVATDEVGDTCSDLIVYTVGTPPVLTVTTPGDGDVVNETESVAFTGTAIDAEDLETDLVLSWVSDVDGEFATDGADSDGDIAFSAELTPGSHTITARATDTDGLYDQTTFDITVNQVPTQPTVTITPDPAYTDNTLTAVATGSTDPDGSGTVTYTYAWYEDGIPSSVSTTATFPGSDTQKHSTYRVVVTPSDGTGTGATGEAERTIDNSEPVLSGPTLSASIVVVGDTLTCSASATDADGDTVSITYAWSDSSTGATYLVTDADDPGDTITCTATADDGDGGVVTGTASATVDNSPPTLSAVTLDKSVVYTNDTLTANVTASDPDGDTVTVTYDWYVEAASVQDGTNDTLDGASTTAGFDKDEAVYVVVTADDGTDTTTATSSTLTVSNTPPDAPVVTIDPSDPVVGEDLFCEVTTESVDADGDTVTYSMDWTVDTVAHSGAITDVWTDDTVDGVDPSGGEVWVCTTTPNDGDDDGTTATDEVTVTQSCSDGSVVFTASSVDFVEVCASSFDVGCTAGQSLCDGDESPVMPVTLTRNYYLSQTEITQAQYQALMGVNPAAASTCGTDCPVEQVSWHMAAAYANAMSSADGLVECYACTGSGASVSCTQAMEVYACEGYRIPTEAEWEGAARCGTDLMFAGSNTVGDVGWYVSNAGSSPQPVASKDSNDCGLYDMSGNVREWTHDVYDATYYTTAGRTDPTGASSGSDVVFRGGGWTDGSSARLRVSDRETATTTHTSSASGFRLARTVDGDYDGDGYLLSEDCDDTDTGVYDALGSASCPALSCEDILDRGASTGDGAYWIDPDGSGAFEVYCDMSIGTGGWTHLLSADGASTYWGNTSSSWTASGTDAAVTSLSATASDFHGAAYSRLTTDEIALCYQDNSGCYIFSHGQSRSLQGFFTSGTAYTVYAIDTDDYSNTGSFSDVSDYIADLGVSFSPAAPASGVHCYWMGINEAVLGSAKIGLIGDGNTPCSWFSGGTDPRFNDSGVGVGLWFDPGRGYSSTAGQAEDSTGNLGDLGAWHVLGR